MKPTIILKVQCETMLASKPYFLKINPNPIPIGKICNIFKNGESVFG